MPKRIRRRGVLLATFSDTLANALRVKLRRLIGNRPSIAERLDVHSMAGVGRRLYEANFGRPNLATDEQVRELLARAAGEVEGHRFNPRFLWTEWNQVVDAWQLESWEDYRDVARLGRKTRLAEPQRAPFCGRSLPGGAGRPWRARSPHGAPWPVPSSGAAFLEGGSFAVRFLRR